MRLIMCLGLALAVVGCDSDDQNRFDAVPIPPAPAIASIEPNQLCSNGTAFTIHGSNFDTAAVVTVDGTVVPATVVDANTITVTVPAGTATTGTHTILVTNPDTQAATGTLTGESAPTMFFVDPNVVSSGLTTPVTIFLSGQTMPIRTVTVQQAGGQPVTLTNVSPVANQSQQTTATITADTLQAGPADVTVSDGVCTATQANALTVVTGTAFTITSVTPSFGTTDTPTTITITTSNNALTATPRVYLATANTTIPLGDVTFDSASRITAVVPQGTPAGDYDVVVVDSGNGGRVGRLANAFHITQVANITSVTPTSVVSSEATTLTVTGTGFTTTTRPTAFLSACTGPTGTQLPTTPLALPPVTNASATQLDVTIPANTLQPGVTCTLRIVAGTPANPANPCPANGTCLSFVDFSAITSVTGAGNLGPFVLSTPTSTVVRPMPTPRARFGAVVGDIGTQPILFAYGGDNGNPAQPKRDVISAPIGRLGEVLAWTTQPNQMTTPRTGLAAARVGQFVYAIGGFNGSQVLNTVERAQILSPTDVPATPTFALTPSTTGVTGGSWVYFVSAVQPTNNASNPGGETLPSAALNVQVPDMSSNTATPATQVTLSFPAVPGAASYNIYRTAQAGQPASRAQLIGTVEQPASGGTVTFTDTGLATTNQSPLQVGSLGKWALVSNLTTRRYGAAAVVVNGGSTATTDTFFLYVAGGASAVTLAPNTLLDTYEWARIDIDRTTGAQTVSPFTLGQGSIGGGRAFLEAFAVDNSINRNVPADTTFVYFGPGLVRTGTTTLGVQSAMVAGVVRAGATTGSLGTLVSVNAPPVGGAAPLTIPGFLFTLGGIDNNDTLQNTFSAALCPNANCTAPAPALSAWTTGGGGVPNVQRLEASSAVDAPFVYLLGGSTLPSGANATNTIERSTF